MRNFLLGLLLALGFGATANAAAEFSGDCKTVRQAVLPFALDRGHIVVEVAVNGHPLHFMVDTGSFVSAISDASAQAIGLHPSAIGQAFRIRDAGGAETRHYARVDDISFAKFRSENLTLMIANLPAGEDGILGPELLRNFDVELDFATQTMGLFKRPRCDEHVVYWTDDFARLPMRITEQGHIEIPVTINGQVIKATVDTGSPYTLIGDNAAQAIIGDNKPIGRSVSLSGGAGGKFGGVGVSPDSLIIGKFKWASPTLISTANKTGWGMDGSEILLGTDILHDLHIFIDYKGGQFFVSKR